MNKLLITICLIFSILVISAQNVTVNTYGKETSVIISVPFSQFFFSAENPETQYQLSVNITDSGKKSAYQKTYGISMNKDQIIERSAYVIMFPITLTPGLYKVNTLFRNLKLGDKKERQFEVSIQEMSNSIGKSFILAENALMQFIPSRYEQLTPDLQSCYLILDTNVECDSIMIKANIDSSISYHRVPLASGFRYDLLSLIQSDRLSDLELRYYTGNIIEVVDGLIYVSNDKYSQLFTPKDQLQQIKYIANQNEWKVINKMAQKDPEGAVEYFWEKHNKSPRTFKNELRDLFYERVLKADELFTIHKKLPGWKSDRGKIYIKKGNPDDIVEDSFPIGRYPYIIWYYYWDNTVYRFFDRTGFGNYKLEEEYREN